MSALPSSVGLPQECMLGSLDYSIPPDAKSFSVKVQPSNQSSVTSPTYTLTGVTASYQAEQAFTSQQIIFDKCNGNLKEIQSPQTQGLLEAHNSNN